MPTLVPVSSTVAADGLSVALVWSGPVGSLSPVTTISANARGSGDDLASGFYDCGGDGNGDGSYSGLSATGITILLTKPIFVGASYVAGVTGSLIDGNGDTWVFSTDGTQTNNSTVAYPDHPDTPTIILTMTGDDTGTLSWDDTGYPWVEFWDLTHYRLGSADTLAQPGRATLTYDVSGIDKFDCYTVRIGSVCGVVGYESAKTCPCVSETRGLIRLF